MNVDDFVFVTPHDVGREDFHEAREHDEINLVLFKQAQTPGARPARGHSTDTGTNGNLFFPCVRRKVGAVGNHEHGVGLEFVAAVRAMRASKQCVSFVTMMAKALAAVGFGEANLDFHADRRARVSSPARRLAALQSAGRHEAWRSC